MTNRTWPLNYTEILAERQHRLIQLKDNPNLQLGALEYYRDKPKEFINHWCITYDPRNASKGLPTILPFILFPRQEGLIDFILDCYNNQESGLIEKSRDMGATWVCCALSIWMWLFQPGVSLGWGSRKEMYVDRVGVPDSIFEKMRMIVDYLPRFFWPEGYKPKEHSTYMKFINPVTGATITGEAGDNIGRGGRTSLYWKDESSHYDRPEKIEASLGDNTDVQIDISSVCGTANVFHRRKTSGVIWSPNKKIEPGYVRVFVLDWRDHPLKTEAWYNKRRAKAEREGLLHKFAEEVDRDATASVERTLIETKWIKAAIDAHITLKFKHDGPTIGALDVADEGRDKNALAARKHVTLKYIEDWAKGDTGETANRAIALAKELKISELQYDCIGVGAGVKSETNRLRRDGKLPEHLAIIPWNAADSPQNPYDSIYGEPDDDDEDEDYDDIIVTNKEFYASLKAQAWWNLRNRFYKTYQAITKGRKYDEGELISIPSDIENRHELEKELAQPTYTHKNGKIAVEKMPNGSKSPNLADATVMCYFPVEDEYVEPMIY